MSSHFKDSGDSVPASLPYNAFCPPPRPPSPPRISSGGGSSGIACAAPRPLCPRPYPQGIRVGIAIYDGYSVHPPRTVRTRQ
eukprot:8187053-Pyramimonas_sp.AAC.1